MSNFPKYSKIKRIGHDENDGIVESDHLVVQEKMDGANFRFMLDEHLDEEHQTDGRDLVFGSKRVAYKNEKDVDGAFEHALEYVRGVADADELRKWEEGLDGHLVLYGEAMHPHTLEYKWDDVPNVLGFDIRLVPSADTAPEYVPWSAARDIFQSIGIQTVPLLFEGDAADLPKGLHPADGVDFPESQYRDGLPEGIVIRNEDSGQRAKIRTKKFKERHKTQSVTDSDEYEPDDSVLLARRFTTEARVLKMIHKYEDRGRSVNNMGIMEDLWYDILDDIIEEEKEEIFKGNYDLNTKDFRSEVASITADVLEMYLNRPDGSVLNEKP